jgi:hypothetical protein
MAILAKKLDSKLQHERLEPIRPILAHDSDTATVATANLDNSLTVHELRRISQRKIGRIVRLYLWVVGQDVEDKF